MNTNESSSYSTVLKARLSHGELCNNKNYAHRSDFISNNGSVTVTEYEDNTGVVVDTPKGSYHLKPSVLVDTFEGFGNGWDILVAVKGITCILTWHK